MKDPGVDIHMPVRCGRYIEGRVLRALLEQDVPTRLFVDAGEDMELTGAIGELLDLIAFDDEELGRVKLRLRAGVKRNRLMFRGDNKFVYLADPDVLPPRQPQLFRAMLGRLAAEPGLGAIGLAYFRNDESHVGAGSMLLRRADYESLGRVRGAGLYCNCDFIKRELERKGLQAVLHAGEIARHLRDEARPGDEVERIPVSPNADGEIPLVEIREKLAIYGERFLLAPSVDGIR